jgi:hypothetical protein
MKRLSRVAFFLFSTLLAAVAILLLTTCAHFQGQAQSPIQPYLFEIPVYLSWRADASAAAYPVDVADGHLDTQALIASGQLQPDCSNLGLLVDARL